MLNADALQQLRQLKTDIESSKVVHNGTVKATNGRFGFVALDDGRDLFLPPEEMQKVLPGDRIRVSETQGDSGKVQGLVEELLESRLNTFVGKYLVKGKGHFVVPETPGINRWIFIPPKHRQNAQPDDFIYCQILRHPIKDGKGQASVRKVLGKAEQPGIERAFTLATYDLEEQWPDAVQKQLENLDEALVQRLAAGREDRREQPYVTIDSPNTQDMDDALWAEPNATGWRLSVAIADPTALIEPGSPLEAEARERATAIYFPGEPRPMLPEALSTKLCSLMPGVDRLAMVCDIQVNNDGSLGDYQFRLAVIRCQAKLSYELAANVIEGREDDDTRALSDTVLRNIDQLHQAAVAMRKWRAGNALLNVDRPEFRLRLDENKRIRQIDPAIPTEAHRLVEDCMVAANRCAADALSRHGRGLFIQHPGLRDDKVDNIRQLLAEHAGHLAEVDPTSPEGFMRMMRETEGLAGELPVKSVISRQLARAELSFTPAPHQGMGLAAYTTFTSPLRKFTDFQVHRLLKSLLWQEPGQDLSEAELERLQAAQIKARQAANSLENWLKSDFARQMDASTAISGVITRTTPAGFFVRLDSNGLEGFVSTKSLPGKYSFDPITLRLLGKDRFFQLDQPVTVTFAGIDEERRQINFNLVETPSAQS
ncbi:MAG: VacB/RNase II family 3'-5' exoribonuclease [Marinobacter sp.]|uniref:ribonuclease R family protein n=1 Tax=Marinobacter sp. TaxID=50741 RepID=UPI00299DFCD2|nr:VacB/RNase II family 3'-5' exoribonuclease [Marinobacter sp.]MDX1634481.1 VacB/RNase II family 3'-5' exoribonuclease [Marinobacter sp.]